ncbi:twin-arginine translocase subunit TatC [Cohnella nanjingensis]|uniref:Sec-independent protein translocase protein TatC n=1 Tax=Cohnella nanjingensis TaxID=1387779 RepID=A0A7X0RW90_9BACL|nr:twin-arginine translocase subunit TatC [Cohnella nanjingensis]MBB6673621.1 twin-arginine translocase subunit TatC [Cohnella nanjingensis]
MSRPFSMPVLSHVSELRKRLIIVASVFAVSMVGGMFAAPSILNYMKSAPPASGMTWNAFSPWDGIQLYMSVSAILAFAVTLPVALHQLWAFVKHGLSDRERTATLRYIPFSLGCLACGLAFGYYVVFPMSFSFVSSVAQRMSLVETYGASQYFRFMLNVVIPIAVAFELPIVVMFLTGIGALTPYKLRKLRRAAYVVLVVVSTAITPPDFLSAFIVLIPLVILYEGSVWLSGSVYRKRTERIALAGAAAEGSAG